MRVYFFCFLYSLTKCARLSIWFFFLDVLCMFCIFRFYSRAVLYKFKRQAELIPPIIFFLILILILLYKIIWCSNRIERKNTRKNLWGKYFVKTMFTNCASLFYAFKKPPVLRNAFHPREISHYNGNFTLHFLNSLCILLNHLTWCHRVLFGTFTIIFFKKKKTLSLIILFLPIGGSTH